MFASKSLSGTSLLAAAALLTLGLAARPAAADHDRFADIGGLLNQLRFAPDDDAREDAAKELGKLGDPRALSMLIQAAVYDREDDVRDAARKSALKITNKVPPRGGLAFTPDLVGRLSRDLMDARDDDDREDAAKALGRLGDPQALTALEIAAVYDKEDDVRDAARKAAGQIRRALGPIREELSYRYYTPEPEPQYAPPEPAPRFERPQPAPRFHQPEPAPRFDHDTPPPPPQPHPGAAEPYYHSPQPAGPTANDRFIGNGTVNSGNTTINNTYNYTYNTTNYYNSNNKTVVNPPASGYSTSPSGYLPPTTHGGPADWNPAPTYGPAATYTPPANHTPPTVYAPPAYNPPVLYSPAPTVCPPPAPTRSVDIRTRVVLRSPPVVVHQPVVVRPPVATRPPVVIREPVVQSGRGMSFSFEFSRSSGSSSHRR